jgi:uncharacterized protein DUF6600/FecR-like protein
MVRSLSTGAGGLGPAATPAGVGGRRESVTMHTNHFLSRLACGLALVVLSGTLAGVALADPPGRVARVSFLRGEVSFQPAGGSDWAEASLNRPLGTGDQLYTDKGARAELQIGPADIRLDQGSTFDLLNLDDTTAQMELSGGVLKLHVRRLASGESYEVDTPTLAFVIDQPGDYRIDVAPQADSTMVTVFEGSGAVYGENNASYSVRAGNAYRFNDTALHDYEVLDLPRPDEFDSWASSREERYAHSASSRYVAPDVIGYQDLDDYGSWNEEADYGPVWYPTRVETGWAPYRSGHWTWIDPWGWSWVDASPWGFAPFHYGRWAYVNNRWGWCPGRHEGGAIYAPALVGFVGGGGWGVSVSTGPVGWFPLGPRDVYVPWYRASRGYFTHINEHGSRVINNTYITNVYNNYSAGRPIANVNYAYQRNAAAFTAVSRETFVGARPVMAARVQVDANRLRGAQVVSRIGIAPTRASFVAPRPSRAAPPAAALNRAVIARTAPPPRPAPIATRLQAIQRNNAQPLQREQLRQIATTRPAAGAKPGQERERVQVVGRNGAKPQPLPNRGTAQPGGARTAPAPRVPAATAGRPTPAATPGRAPAAAPQARGNVPDAGRRALPSSRFAHPGNAPANAPGQRPASAERGAAERGPASRTAPRATPEQSSRASQVQRPTPQQRAEPARAPRETPQSRSAPREMPQPRSTPREVPQSRATPRETPQSRTMPRETPQPRSTPREMPQSRSAPRAMPQPRETPQPRSAPERPAPRAMSQERQAPREMPRPAPQQRPVPQQGPRAMPQQREAPRQQRAPQREDRNRDDRKDRDKDH